MELTNGMHAIVTGGGSGMGEATARYFAKLGAKLTLLDIDYKKATTVANEIGGSAIECNVADEKNVEAAVEQANAQYGPARVCVNCAGIAPAERIVGREGVMPLSHFEKVIQVNLIGSFNVMRIVAKEMMETDPVNSSKERGVIIHTASVAAFEGQIGQSAYSASKGGVVGMTLPAAREFSKFGIRVMTIAPGIIATPMLLNMPVDVQESLAQQVPFPKRLGDPDEYAQLARHIVENAMLNGSVIRLDGAIRMQPK